MNLVYNVKDRPTVGKIIIFALQQLLAIMAATVAVPFIVGNGMSQTAALFGAGVGTLVYLLFTRFKSPVFLGSSFAFLPSMFAAFAGAATVALGFLGLIIGAVFAGLVYVILALVIKKAGTNWIDKLMPAAVIGPVVALIGLSLAGNAIGDMFKWFTLVEPYSASLAQDSNGNYVFNNGDVFQVKGLLTMLIGLATLFTVIICSVYGKKTLKMIPFVCGIGVGYTLALILTLIGTFTETPELVIINFELFKISNIEWYPDFSFIKAIKGIADIESGAQFFKYLGTIAVAYAPVAFVVFAEHLADHKNLSTIIGTDLTKEPGLDKTLLGDGVGSIAGAVFGGCPNTTYGESIGCVAISGNASIITIVVTALMAIVIAFIGPFAAFLKSIPNCVMGGICVSLYGFIAVSGLKMIQKVDLNDNKNLFVVSVILIAGVGGMGLNFYGVVITKIAVALILGIVVNLICNRKAKKEAEEVEQLQSDEKSEK